MPLNKILQYKLNDFEGPLDLLLFLIRKNEVNIYDIPIAEITEQYLQFLELATKIDLETMTDFTLMAATLMFIKSQMLLPLEFNIEDEIDDPREDLVEKLIEYQKYKKLGNAIAEREIQLDWSEQDDGQQIALPFEEKEDVWDEVKVWDLLKIFSSLVSAAGMERIVDIYEEVSLNEKIALVHELLDKGEDFSFGDLVVNGNNLMEIICAFLAVLELVKQGQVSVLQNRLFGEIRIIKV